MKKKLNFCAAIASLVLSVNSHALTLYGDPETGQIYYQPGEGRTKIEVVDDGTEAKASSTKQSITIIDEKSPEFMMGKQTHINMKFQADDTSDMWFKAGVRVQGTFETQETDKYNTGGSLASSESISDVYLRRARLEIAAGFGEHTSFTMDIRNDKSNFGIENNEGNFKLGDAYIKIKNPFDTSLVNFKLLRAKIDVSRTETVKSARLITYDRPFIADAAAQYISLNRRGANAQMYGDWKKKIHYQIAAGSASSPDKTLDALGVKGSSVDIDTSDQSLFYGGKVIFSPFDGWEETQRTETYFGEGKHFSVGVAYWDVPTLKGDVDFGTYTSTFDLNRKLINYEVSAHYNGFFVQGEYFEFKDAVKQWDTGVSGTVDTGSSSGWYVTSEYVFKDFYYLAPFVRYEKWDRFDDESGYDVESSLVGVNWYLRGNTTKVGLVYQQDEFGVNTGNRDVDTLRVTTQWFF
ncbi:MAG: porin [Oceanicoccus sp.]